jgi:multidrug efflux pump
MNISDLSIKRPVFAMVLSLLIVAFGYLSFERLPLRELPDIDPPVVSVQASYPGASATVVETRITQPIEDAIAGIEGIDTVESRSRDGQSDVTVTFKLSRDIEAAANDVRNAVARITGNLPDEVDPPEVRKAEADSSPILFLNLTSTQMNRMDLTDYADRYIVDRLSTVDGVAQVRAFGERKSLRIWLDRVALAARNLTVNDVETALRAENVELPAGRLESADRNLTVRIDRGYNNETDFRNLVIRRGEAGHMVRLGELGRVEISAAERRSDFRGNGQSQVGIGIIKQSTANQLAVARNSRDEVAAIQSGLPEGMNLVVAVDYSVFIEESVYEVYMTLAITGAMVILVIFLFLGNIRAAVIPAVTVPVCLLGATILVAAFGASINLLTLLALVLAIGLVVDDAIVVLENVQRRIDLGEPPLIAAARGTRQVAFAVMATTAVLLAVFVPIVFLEGTVGRLFSELGIALGAAVALSLLVALTLTPMMCSKLLKPIEREGLISRTTHRVTDSLSRAYRSALSASLGVPWIVFGVLAATIASVVFFYQSVPSEIAPTEDRGVFDITVSAPEGTGYDTMHRQMLEIEKVLLPLIEQGTATRVIIRVPGSFGSTQDFNSGRGTIVLGPWGDRPPQEEVVRDVSRRLQQFPAVRATAIARSSFGRGGGGNNPVQFVLGGTSFEELAAWRDRILQRAEEFPGLINLDSDLKETKPQLNVEIDRLRAADLGVSVSTIGRTLEAMLGERRAGTFIDRGEEYDILLQGLEENRRQPSDLTNIFVRSDRTSQLVPLSNLVKTTETASASTLNRFNRLRSVTISGAVAPGTTLGQALDYLERIANEELPETAQIDYKGQSLEFKQSSGSLLFTFGLALLVVFLVLAAQFESFVHPLVIILTVPLAVAGALFGLWATGATMNIYSQIGIVMLVGLAAKNGILIVEFANQLRDAGRSIKDALIEASITRFRPILMTSVATAMGTLPLMIWQGAGSQSRFAIGIVIFAGVIFSTALTLFVVPTFYNLLARFTRAPGKIAADMADWERLNPGVVAGEHAVAGEHKQAAE